MSTRQLLFYLEVALYKGEPLAVNKTTCMELVFTSED